MKRFVLHILAGLLPFMAHAQRYADSIAQYRQHYKSDFLTDARSPLKTADTGFLRFYPADIAYRVKAIFVPTPQSPEFSMPTHSGKDKAFRQYGTATFRLHDTLLVLHVYQNLALIKDPKYKDDLFIPFTDLTNYEETYAGGRYIDVSINDIKKNELILDFNTCYNPYCAFATGYSCPIPPDENKLPVHIRAGEKLFGKDITEE
jgi:hypothetical protein